MAGLLSTRFKFSDFKGNALKSDPRSMIKENNRKINNLLDVIEDQAELEWTKNYKEHVDFATFYDVYKQVKLSELKIDYQAFDAQTRTGIAEKWGWRDTQEDRVVVDQLNEYADLSEGQRHAVLRTVVDALQLYIKAENLKGGSTLCAVLLCGNQIYTANVGDSMAFLVIAEKDGSITEFRRLNKVLHNPGRPEEKARLEAEGFEVDIKRIRTDRGDIIISRLGEFGLALSRSLGDTMYEVIGLSHEPDVYFDNIIIPKNGIALIINACDGLTEGNSLKENDIKKIISNKLKEAKNYARFKPEKLAAALAEGAYREGKKELGSTDNISVIVTVAEPLAKEPTKSVKYCCVFDGHGGDEVSDYLYRHFHRVLNNCIAAEKANIQELRALLGLVDTALNVRHWYERPLSEIQENSIIAILTQAKIVLNEISVVDGLTEAKLAFQFKQLWDIMFQEEIQPKIDFLNILEGRSESSFLRYEAVLNKITGDGDSIKTRLAEVKLENKVAADKVKNEFDHFIFSLYFEYYKSRHLFIKGDADPLEKSDWLRHQLNTFYLGTVASNGDAEEDAILRYAGKHYRKFYPELINDIVIELYKGIENLKSLSNKKTSDYQQMKDYTINTAELLTQLDKDGLDAWAEETGKKITGTVTRKEIKDWIEKMISEKRKSE